MQQTGLSRAGLISRFGFGLMYAAVTAAYYRRSNRYLKILCPVSIFGN